MKIQILSFLSITFSVLFFACKECPPDENYGRLNLSAETFAYFSFLTADSVVYKNAAGQEKEFELWKSDLGNLQLKTSAVGVLCQSRRSDSYLKVTVPAIEVYFYQKITAPTDRSGLDFDLRTILINENYENPYDTLLAEYIRIVSHLNNPEFFPPDQRPVESRLQFYSAYRNNFASDFIPFENDFSPQLQLLDKSFSNVHHNLTTPKIWMNNEFGIVAFEDKEGALWVFERFE